MSVRTGWTLARRSPFFWFGSFFSILGVVLAGLALQGVQQERAYQQEGVVVDGTVLTTFIEHAVRGERPRTRYLVSYRYHAQDGVLRKGLEEVSVEEWESLHDGDAFRVRYLRDSPDTSRAATDSDWTDPVVLAVVASIVGTVGGGLLTHRLRQIRLTLSLLQGGEPTEGTVVRVSPSDMKINGVPQWEVHYRYVDQSQQRHDGCSDYLSPSESRSWKKGDRGMVRYDRRNPSVSIWVGRDVSS
jgi:hypothetical protein